jgi:NAD(P)-dependent dehydrogenase (short-subunit alcohol dehydrogenase family)
MDFEKHTIIVSGSSSGIGKSCAELLLNNGADVIGLDMNGPSIGHPRYRHHVVDICNETMVAQFSETLQKDVASLYGLVNGAGRFSFSRPFYEIDLDEWNTVIATNLTGTFLLSKYVSGHLIKNRRGKIVTISCIRSRIFRPNMADYAASKGGVVALTSVMALDLAKYNIQVNSVAPGFTYTGMTAKSFDNSDIRKESEKIIPAQKIASPEDIGNVVLFLLSADSDYITGETITVDGGYSISK